MSTSKLDELIKPEIKKDLLYEAIQIISATEPIKTVLEIGSSSGGGSTEAFVAGLRNNPNNPSLFCMEVSQTRYEKLCETYEQDKFVKCYNVSSISLQKYATEYEVIDFYSRYQNKLIYPIEQVLGWLREEIDYIQRLEYLSNNGIQKIKQENNIDYFDVVLIDGSEFTGKAELEEVYGAKFIILDDIKTFKNFQNHHQLLEDKQYRLIEKNDQLRNGYSIFKKNSKPKTIREIVSASLEEKENLLTRIISPRDTVFEIGKHQDNYTFLLSYLVGYLGKIYSFNSITSQKLEEINREYDLNNNINLFEEIGEINLDSFCQEQNLEKIDFLTINLDEQSNQIFNNCQNLLKNHQIKYIQLKTQGKQHQDIFDILRNNGYECHEISDTDEIGEEVTQPNSDCQEYMAFPQLPIHFLTIVLNGEPFVRYHIDVFSKLPFPWHWHIVEGVASLKHDTAWSLARGGRVTDDIHKQGRSIDGTTEYLDELAQKYPEHVTIYRKPLGEFWEGKLEMVNAPLVNIKEESLLWQVDVDEFWTEKQIITGKNLFINYPRKTAAYYWCWYFVGEDLIISSRNCYTQNPQQDWLRTWRIQPDDKWLAHEPPTLSRRLNEDKIVDVARINPFLHGETEAKDLIFQHFAYVKPEQLEFKEKYYGYQNALAEWQKLQQEARFPTLLRQYFSWVKDGTMVDKAQALGIAPILHISDDSYQFKQQEIAKPKLVFPKIIVDAVFFQRYQTGIARLWYNLLQEWVEDGFAKHLVVLDRMVTAPTIPGINYRLIPPHDEHNREGDRQMLQQICDEQQAQLFISTYYTTPLETPSVFMAYDMIPEVLGADLNQPMWQEKHQGIEHACSYISISANTAKDLVKYFPEIDLNSVTVAHCGVQDIFTPPTEAEINQFKYKYGIAKPYFLVMGALGYKNPQLFYQALAKLPSKQGFDVVATGAGGLLPPELRELIPGVVVHRLQLSDEELRLAYGGAIALVYPSKYEGFGLPVLEAMSCGTPVITSPNASIPEVGGEAVIYVNDQDADALAEAICEVQKPKVRANLISLGLARAQQFSWKKMATTVKNALIAATLLPLNLREINLLVFPDWSLSEEDLYTQFTLIFQKLATYSEQKQMTLLIDTQGIDYEDANLLISSLMMGLLMEDDSGIDEELQISLVPELSSLQWDYLLTRVQGRISVEMENI